MSTETGNATLTGLVPAASVGPVVFTLMNAATNAPVGAPVVVNALAGDTAASATFTPPPGATYYISAQRMLADGTTPVPGVGPAVSAHFTPLTVTVPTTIALTP